MTTTKTSALTLAALVVAGALATPVLATDHSPLFDSSYYITQLRYDGVNAVAVEDAANGALRATVKLADGTETFQYFDKDSFQPVNIGADTRIARAQ